MGAVGEGHGGGDASELLGGDHAGEQAGVGAAVAFVDRDAVEAEVAEHRPEVGVPAVVAVHLVGDGVDFGVGEVADDGAEHLLGFSELDHGGPRFVRSDG